VWFGRLEPTYLSESNLTLVGLAPSVAFTAFTRSNHPFLSPNISPGMNPKAAATGKPAATVVECAAN
jgi:hypothetical protein